MLKLDVDRGNKRVLTQLAQSDDATRRGIRQFWFALGKTLLKSFNRAVLQKPRSGRVYLTRKNGRTRRHVASRPGESPANLTGTYRKSADYQLRGANEMLFGVDAPYGAFLENGTRRMKARPGLGNAVAQTEGESIATAASLIERELHK